MDRTCQIIQSLNHQSSAPTELLSALQAELTNINDIYTSKNPSLYQPLFFWTQIHHFIEIQTTTNVLEEAYYPS